MFGGIHSSELRGASKLLEFRRDEPVGYSREDLPAGRMRWPDLSPPEYAAQDELAHEEGPAGEQWGGQYGGHTARPRANHPECDDGKARHLPQRPLPHWNKAQHVGDEDNQ